MESYRIVPTPPLAEKIKNPGLFYRLDELYMNEEQFENVFGKPISIIGIGVYAKVTLTDKNFAIKHAIGEYCDSEGVSCSAMTEIAILNYLHHPNILPIYGVNFDLDKCMFSFAMPLAQGSLKDEMRSNKFDLYHRKIVMYQILRGLAYCHSKLIWHLDIKPENILKFTNGEYKLTDFGLSKIYAINGKAHSTKVITPSYRPPEVVIEDKYYTETVDVWSAGAILLQLITGEDMFRLTRNDSVDELSNIVDVLGSPNVTGGWPEFVKLARSSMKNFRQFEYFPDFDPKPKPNTLVEILKKFNVNQDEISIIQSMIAWSNNRKKAIDLLDHPYFDQVRTEIKNKFPAEPIITYNCAELMLSQQVKLNVPTSHAKDRNVRSKIFDWIWTIFKSERTRNRTIFLTFLLYDIYSSKVNEIPIKNEQLIILATFTIASKLTEDLGMSMSDLSYLSDGAYSIKDIIEMELQILITIDFNLIVPTCANFSDYMVSNQSSREGTKLMYDLMAVIMTNEKWAFGLTQNEIAQTGIQVVESLHQLVKTECFNRLTGNQTLTLEEIIDYMNRHKDFELIKVVLSKLRKDI